MTLGIERKTKAIRKHRRQSAFLIKVVRTIIAVIVIVAVVSLLNVYVYH